MTGEQKAFLSFCCSVAVLQFSLSCAQLLAGLWQGNLPGPLLCGTGRWSRSPGAVGMSPWPHHRNQKNRKTHFSPIMSVEPQLKNKGRGSSLRLMLFFGKKSEMLSCQGWFVAANVICGHKYSCQWICTLWVDSGIIACASGVGSTLVCYQIPQQCKSFVTFLVLN